MAMPASVSKRHVVEPHELDAEERTAFFSDVVAIARALDRLFRPVKLNYEIHGNTIPHLHLHLFPRYRGDPFENGPVRRGEHHATHSGRDLEQMARVFGLALREAEPRYSSPYPAQALLDCEGQSTIQAIGRCNLLARPSGQLSRASLGLRDGTFPGCAE